jgi:hypothetical protein
MMTAHSIRGTGGRRFGPESNAGKWSVGLFLVFAAALAVFLIVARAGAGTWEPEFFADLELTIPFLISAASVLGSLVVGFVAMVKADDRSTAVILVTVISGMVTLFFAGELLSVVGVLPQH